MNRIKLMNEIRVLLAKITYEEYKKLHPKTKKQPNDPMFADSNAETASPTQAPKAPAKSAPKPVAPKKNFTPTSTSDASKAHGTSKSQLESFEQKTFGGKATTKALAALKKSNPEAVKEHNRLKREVTKAYAFTRQMVFHEAKASMMDAQEFHKKMSALGLDSRVDPAFKGKLNADGHFFTSGGKKLPGVVGKKVVINTAYDPQTDDTYYCKSVNINGNVQTHYTEEYFVKKKKQKYAKNLDFGKSIEDIRGKLSEDIKSTDPIKQTMALMVHLVDQAYFRIGNAKSEKNGVFGLHNLQSRHIKIEGNKVHFDYIGKDKVHQKHTVESAQVAKMVGELLKGKGANDSVFTVSGKLVTPDMINSYLKKDLKSPVTVHKFRTYHATRLARELLEGVSMTPPPNEKKVLDLFKKSVDSIAEKMGHTSSNTTVKHYIDSNILLGFFSKYKVEPPKILAKVASIFRSFFASGRVVATNDFFDMTPSEEAFNLWMESLPPSILEAVIDMGQSDEEGDE
jgi:DNA topoisomerase-1